MRQWITPLRYEASVLQVSYRALLADLRRAGAISRDPNGRGHTVRRGWHDRFRERRFHHAIRTEDGREFHRETSVVYATRKGQRWLAEFVAHRQDGEGQQRRKS